MGRIRTIIAATAAALAVVLLTAAPAAAHDELVASTPAAHEQLAAAPSEISLTFSAEILDVGAKVIVVDAEGTDWVAAEPVIAGTDAVIALTPDMPEAGYEVRWRVVSSDGHPISGVIPFTVGDAAPLERSPAAAPTADAGSDAGTGDDTGRIVLLGAGGAVAAVAVLALILFFRRRASAGGRDA